MKLMLKDAIIFPGEYQINKSTVLTWKTDKCFSIKMLHNDILICEIEDEALTFHCYIYDNIRIENIRFLNEFFKTSDLSWSIKEMPGCSHLDFGNGVTVRLELAARFNVITVSVKKRDMSWMFKKF